MAGHFEHSYADLGTNYASPQPPSPVRAPSWLAFNQTLADALGWPADWRQTPDTLAALAGNATWGNARPVATVYAGHQFGSYNPRLGDGRAILLGEWVTGDGQRFDIQLKGAGTTPYSRGGDGRSPIGPVVREYLVSEAMHALGVPTTRALAAVASGEPVYRDRVEPGAILTRVASSHLRIGTVQYFAMTQGGDGLAELVDYVVARHYADDLAAARAADPDTPAAKVLLSAYSQRLAALVAQWQVLGFVHGVLNTDNLLLCGETVDYGPCAFMDQFDPNARFSSIDRGGRYAWPNQPTIAHWNLSVLAQCLLPLIDADAERALSWAQAVVDHFPAHYTEAHGAQLARKFGLGQWRHDDQPLVDAFYQILAEETLDHTLAFRWLTEQAAGSVEHSPLGTLFPGHPRLNDWLSGWRKRIATTEGSAMDTAGLDAMTLDVMRQANPCVIPRNHQVAAAITAAENGDSSELARLATRWASPYTWQAGDEDLARGPEEDERVMRTFCGT